ncbi:MAG: response regulator [Isosphaeraceae bacterium]
MSIEAPVILVVDDEEDICRNLADILGDIGCEVDTANDGATALEMVRRKPYDVALLDVRMPGMNGIDLCQAIRSVRPGTVAILVTAFGGTGLADQAMEVGAWQVLSKPVDLPILLRLVDEAAGQPMILVVDDDRDLCRNLWDLFRERGYRTSMAHDLEEAETRLREGSFGLVLIDMKLPSSTGVSVLRLVRTTSPAARTVLITGHRPETDDLIQEALRNGADAVCYKPLDMSSLFDAVQSLTRSGPGRSASPGEGAP